MLWTVDGLFPTAVIAGCLVKSCITVLSAPLSLLLKIVLPVRAAWRFFFCIQQNRIFSYHHLFDLLLLPACQHVLYFVTFERHLICHVILLSLHLT